MVFFGGGGKGMGGDKLTRSWAREQGLGVGEGGKGGYSTTDPEAGMGCKC